MKEDRRLSNDPATSDQAVLARVAGKDAQALADLYDRFAPVALALAGRILGDRSEAEDVLQAVVTRIWQEAYRYDSSKESPASWILSWVRSGAIDRLRRRDAHGRARQQTAGLGPAAPEDGPADEERRTLAAVVAQLPPDQRQAIELAYFEGLSQSRIAHRLGEPLGTVKTRVRLGMDRLKQALPKNPGDSH